MVLPLLVGAEADEEAAMSHQARSRMRHFARDARTDRHHTTPRTYVRARARARAHSKQTARTYLGRYTYYVLVAQSTE